MTKKICVTANFSFFHTVRKILHMYTHFCLSISASLSTSRIFFLAAAEVTATSLLPIPAAVAEVKGIVLTSLVVSRSEFELEEWSESELERLLSRLE